MAKLSESATWEDGIYQLELNDPVEGGPDGVDNLQAKQLANRTAYLKQQAEQVSAGLAGHAAAPDPHPQYLTPAEGDSRYPPANHSHADYLPTSQKGAAGGLATLGGDGKLPAAQLPSITASDVGALPLSGGDMTGRAGLKTYDLVAVSLGSLTGAKTIDLTQGNYFQGTVTGATTLTILGAAAAGRAHGFVLELTNGGTALVSWPTSVKWPSGSAPILTTTGVDVLVFVTDDGGATWRANLSIKDSR